MLKRLKSKPHGLLPVRCLLFPIQNRCKYHIWIILCFSWHWSLITASTISAVNDTTTSAIRVSTTTPLRISCYCGPPFITLSAASTATLQSPNYPDDYSSNCDCTWFISAPTGYNVKITFDTFRTETNYDTLTVIDASSTFKQLKRLVDA